MTLILLRITSSIIRYDEYFEGSHFNVGFCNRVATRKRLGTTVFDNDIYYYLLVEILRWYVEENLLNEERRHFGYSLNLSNK